MPPIATEFTCHDELSRSAAQADFCSAAKNASLFDNLVCERKHPIRHGQPLSALAAWRLITRSNLVGC